MTPQFPGIVGQLELILVPCLWDDQYVRAARVTLKPDCFAHQSGNEANEMKPERLKFESEEVTKY